jgi:hypothetical protein
LLLNQNDSASKIITNNSSKKTSRSSAVTVAQSNNNTVVDNGSGARSNNQPAKGTVELVYMSSPSDSCAPTSSKSQYILDESTSPNDKDGERKK